ncbi:zinc-binding dehydrogenase [Tetragenococcus halophilus]|uniref:zinc-binding dehydrogenase n=3 Tax=Tetragenococcus halophilus TaxID=51669 RepID=UPI000B92AB6B|nr:zinc-binding dehydrogenase [Tetragenococcus halophilus]GMG68174.1 zinc-binding dehydrogenase [Tetragenococcus halophilus]
MRALMKLEKGFNNMKVVEIDEPEVKDDLVKVKVKYCGICGSDLHAYQGTYPSTIPPVVLGHEFAGEVVDIGTKVKNINIGDRVTSETTFATCNNCEQCKTKDYNLCSNRKGIGTQVNGAMATYVLSREESIHVLGENVSYLSAALSEPLSCGVHASLEKVEVQKGDTVCVFGPGTIGILLAMVAKSKGARVIVAGVTKDEKRLELVKKLGLISVDQQKEDLKEIIDEHTQEKGVDFSFECSGVVKALNTALVITKKRGTIVQMGVFAKDFNEIDTQSILQKEINYIGSRSQKPSSWEKTMELLSDQVISPEQIVTSIISLENWKDGFENSIAANDIKVVIDLEKD